MRRRIFAALSIVAMAISVGGCTGVITAPTLTPKIAPPVIVKAGVLRAAIDLESAPFAGSAKGRDVGLDIDVAAAVAEQLGLKLEIVDAKSDAAMAAVKDGSVDIMLGGLTVESAVASQVAFAGTYISDAPAVFAAKGASITIDALGTKRVAVQTGSVSYWSLLDKFGPTSLIPVATLDAAFQAVASGTADVAAGDALVGAYLLRGYPDLGYVGQIDSAFPLGIGVSQAKPDLETQMRAALDKLAAQGVLETIRHKWFGDLPPLRVTESSVSQDTSATTAATTTP
jgi:polar amino acid transport system substrate-binding protein